MGYGLTSQKACMTLLDTMFMALPGKWANLSFNLSFDVAFLNNHGFAFSFLSSLVLLQILSSLCVLF